MVNNNWLVVSTYPSEKYEFVSWDDEIPNIWKNKSHVPNHQPVMLSCYGRFFLRYYLAIALTHCYNPCYVLQFFPVIQGSRDMGSPNDPTPSLWSWWSSFIVDQRRPGVSWDHREAGSPRGDWTRCNDTCWCTHVYSTVHFKKLQYNITWYHMFVLIYIIIYTYYNIVWYHMI